MVRHRWLVAVLLVLMPVVAFPAASAAADDDCIRLRGVCVRFDPPAAPVGTEVRFSGYVDAEDIDIWAQAWAGQPSVFLLRTFPPGGRFGTLCELLVGGSPSRLDFDVETGTVSGSFVVGLQGTCVQEEENTRTFATPPGMYQLSAGCHACQFSRFRVMPGSLPATGSPSGAGTAAVGLVLVGAGSVLLLLIRKRRPT